MADRSKRLINIFNGEKMNPFGILVLLPALLLLVLQPATLNSQELVEDIGQREVDNLVFNEGKIEQVLAALGNKTGTSITPLGKITNETVTLIAKDTTLEETLNKITKPKGWRYWKTENGLGYNVSDEQYYVQNVLPDKAITRIFRPDHVKAEELESAISDMLTPGIGTVTPDPRTNKLIVSDLPEVIERIQYLIQQIDVQLFTRVFYIRHSDVSEVAEKIESYKSEPGTIETDEKTHQIIVTDLLSNIKKMELLIDILDVGPEIVIYDVNNIGLEGSDLEDLQTIIDGIRTEDLLFEINEKQGVFILEDVPEIHERVEQILAGFDQPVKQVLIQGEIITTAFSRGLDYGIDRLGYGTDPIATELSPAGFTFLEGGTSGGNGGSGPDGNSGSNGGSNKTFFSNSGSDVRNNIGFIELSGDTIAGGLLGSQAVLDYRLSFSDTSTKVLLQPRLLVKNQESSRIFVGREEPFLTTFFNDNTSGNTTRSTSQSTVTDGLTFEITPSISNSYLVEMEIQIDNDDAEVVSRTSGDQTTDLIARDRQSLETVLTIPSGQTRVIGGLISSSENEGSGGVPFLSSLPYIGGLFGTQSERYTNNNLQLFITPTIVEDVVPRPTGEDGKRGRTVTGFERLPGNYDLNSDSELATNEVDDIPADELLSTDDEDANAQIEDLLRDTTILDSQPADSEVDTE